jgi:hypothetical protein
MQLNVNIFRKSPEHLKEVISAFKEDHDYISRGSLEYFRGSL